jgi:undecaprenyl-diphosphatase
MPHPKIWHGLLMGITQGITEFLPISSTAHLNLLSKKLGKKPDLVSDTALHLGSLAATVFWLYRRRSQFPYQDQHFWQKVIVATLPVGITGFLLEKPLQKLRRPPLTASLLITGGLALLITDYATRHRQGERSLSNLPYLSSLGIGMAQTLALLPGLSRSGMTQMAGQWSRLSAEEAQHFSFVLAVPVVAASAAFEMRHLSWSAAKELLPGLVSAGISSHLMLNKVDHFAGGFTYRALGVYRMLLGAYLLKNQV